MCFLALLQLCHSCIPQPSQSCPFSSCGLCPHRFIYLAVPLFWWITEKHWITPLLFHHEVKLQNWPLLLDNKYTVMPSIPRSAGIAATWRFVCHTIFIWLNIFSNNKVHWACWLSVKWGQDQFYSRRTNGCICDLNINDQLMKILIRNRWIQS